MSASEAVVQEVLQMDQLEVPEKEVLEALMKWGQAQVEADGHDPSYNAKLRIKIGSSLKCVRWALFDNKQFAELCQRNLGQIFSAEEKLQVMECFAMNYWAKMPEQLSPVCLKPRLKENFSLELDLRSGRKEKFVKGKISFSLEVNKRCCFVGLKIINENHSGPVKDILEPNYLEVAETGYPTIILGQAGPESRTFMIQTKCILEVGVSYDFFFTFPRTLWQSDDILFPSYVVNNRRVGNDKLTITVSDHIFGVHVKELIFKIDEQ